MLDHDFPSDAKWIAIPYGIYDFCRNEGFVNLGTSRDTAEFAVAPIGNWWKMNGSVKYPDADRFNLCVKVCHYPSGASKWNFIEYRMFCFISSNWVAQPLTDYETVFNLSGQP